MKKTIALLSAVMALLLAAGCSNDGKTTPSSVPDVGLRREYKIPGAT